MEGGGGFDVHDFHSQWHFHQNPLFPDSGGPISPMRYTSITGSQQVGLGPCEKDFEISEGNFEFEIKK
ncbi:hypothetical protein PsorP6_004761 [Peronosclerospora sorghi]|uniref:Uncharacterized protein n=1 Tax=Peronosclerospora sorghi TaxID=230839 RepID=A0ACC0VLT1_9STRA|nr:hypothetical protein PsorP6_004761 [Peronosclerospora sorghi]